MQRAGAARDQQHAARVFSNDALLRQRLLADGVRGEPGDGRELGGVRPDLAQQRIVRIAFAHARHEAARHEQRKRDVRGAPSAAGGSSSSRSSSAGSRTALCSAACHDGNGSVSDRASA